MGRANVKVLREDENGLNELLSINGITYDNETAYRMAKNGQVE